MSGPIQIIPPGLLGYFQLKNRGRNPTDMPETLFPMMDLLEWYLHANGEQLATLSFSIPATGSDSQPFAGLGGIVPNGEWWYVHYMCAFSAPLLAADTVEKLQCAVIVSDPSPQTILLGQASNQTMTGANKRQWAGGQMGAFIGPGAALGIFYSAITATNITITGNARISRLPI